RYQVAAIIATIALVLSALYVLWLYQRMMGGPVRADPGPVADADSGEAHGTSITDLVPREILVVAPLIALLIILGVYPKPVLDVITPAVDHTLVTVGEQDPVPLVRPETPVADGDTAVGSGGGAHR
ncbi:MAG TPA: NADH-quinone oxidoreductase subunit M, partial [Rhodococcus sp. (in: high G+C Gram-positive bacteria)]|nr:NADH-quinone oxidoreductase subunit M [Rhodococcus sp. (in: high G+C Gram-positive bacteria)]